MKLRDKKGSISIFVLVALLFMSAFLIILYANNVNKSKTVKEQFNIISGIYAYGDGDEGAYDKAYTDLRKKNKQIMTAYSENSSTLELTKTFEDEMGNLRIYGNSVQNGTPTLDTPVEIQSVGDTKNLFDINKALDPTNYVQTSYGYYGLPIKVEIGKTYTFNRNNTNGYGLELGNIGFKNSVDAAMSGWLVHSTSESLNHSIYTFTATTDVIYFATNVNTESKLKQLFDTVLKDAQFEEGDTATEYEAYGKCKILMEISGGAKNSFYGKFILGHPSSTTLYNYRIHKKMGYLEAGTYTFSVNNDKDIKISIGSYSTESYDNAIKNTGWQTGKATITIDNGAYVALILKKADDSKITLEDIKDYEFQFEEGNDLYLYKGKIFEIVLNEPLRKVGDVADYIDFKTGQVVRKIGKVILKGTEEWHGYDSGNGYRTPSTTFINGNPVLSNRFINSQSLTTNLAIRKNYDNIYCYGIKESYTSADDWESFLSTNPLIVYGSLVTLPDPEPINLPELQTYEDYTKIEILTEVAPSKIESEYTGYALD